MKALLLRPFPFQVHEQNKDMMRQYQTLLPSTLTIPELQESNLAVSAAVEDPDDGQVAEIKQKVV